MQLQGQNGNRSWVLEVLFHGIEASDQGVRNERWPCSTDIRKVSVLFRPRIVTRYMGSGIKGQKKGGIRDHNPWNQDQRYFPLDQGSGVPDQQNFAG